MSDITRKYKVDKYKSVNSRYKDLWRIEDSEGNIYIETSESFSIPEKSDDYYFVVTPKYENRLDLVSHKYYQTPLLWWVIAEASNIFNPLSVPCGTTLRIPSKSSLYGYGGKLL